MFRRDCFYNLTFRFACAAAFGAATMSIFAVAISLAADPADSKLKDAEVIAFFRANRDALERLRQMAAEDATVVSFIDKRSIEDSALSPSRRTQYKTLLDRLNRDIGVGTGSRQVTFHLESGGSAIERSWTKGIAYLSDPPSKIFIIVSTLDQAPKVDGVYLVPIEGNWYIAFGIID